MARLNEPPVSTDSVEILRRKLLRQNRDLAKSNNVRALRIRELENECACMLSENLELRGRILELEKQVDDNESRRIADHALAIKTKLESQLTEWGTLLAGLGLEPPMKSQSPRVRRSSKQRMSFHCNRPSPSQRRLRDIAKDIEDLGHISENKSYSRMSLNPQQILALRSEADSADSPELGPPPMSHFIDDEPIKVDSPCTSPLKTNKSPPKTAIEPPVTLASPGIAIATDAPPSPSPVKVAQSPIRQPKLEPKRQVSNSPNPERPTAPTEEIAPLPVKTGFKRKLASRDDSEVARLHESAKENQTPRAMAGKTSIREKAHGKTLKELTGMRKETNERPAILGNRRKPLAAKSTNDDISSPRKTAKVTAIDGAPPVKADLVQSSATQDKPKIKGKGPTTTKVHIVPPPDLAPITATATATCELGMPVAEPVLLSPSSPEPAVANEVSRGDTPPPADITSSGETSRPSRRNRTAVSYAEPNLRDKMRRPTKEMVDAVTGSRRSSHYLASTDTAKPKRESEGGDTLRKVPAAETVSVEKPVSAEASTIGKPEPGSIPASPLAGKGAAVTDLPVTIATSRRRRTASAVTRVIDSDSEASPDDTSKDEGPSDVTAADSDLYEFTSSSPQTEKQAESEGRKKAGGKQSKTSRRFSATVDNDEYLGPKDRASSRRRSMMV